MIMKKRFLPVLVLLPLFFACNESAETPEAPAAAEAPAPPAAHPANQLPSLALRDMRGATLDLASLKGKNVFVNLWASWCPPCKREMPSIEKLYASVDTARTAFVLLSLDENVEEGKQYMKQSGLKLPAYFPAGGLPPMFNVQSIPTTFIFDSTGSLVQRIEGMENYDTEAFRAMFR